MYTLMSGGPIGYDYMYVYMYVCMYACMFMCVCMYYVNMIHIYVYTYNVHVLYVCMHVDREGGILYCTWVST